jgi:hypothetical protein
VEVPIFAVAHRAANLVDVPVVQNGEQPRPRSGARSSIHESDAIVAAARTAQPHSDKLIVRWTREGVSVVQPRNETTLLASIGRIERNRREAVNGTGLSNRGD